MEVKGTAVAPMVEYVNDRFKSRYDEWLGSLSPQARTTVQNPLAGSWYPLDSAILEPTQKVCALFHQGNERGAWEIGRFSAEAALKGIYKMFIKLGSPGFIVSRGSRIIANYYRPCQMDVVESDSHKAVLNINFEKAERLVELRIGGWMERAIELSGKKCSVKLRRTGNNGRTVTEYTVTWE